MPVSAEATPRAIQREILLWTTKDGREIPLDEMTDDHIANAVRVLTVWRSRVRKRDAADPVVRDLADAIDRFKRIQRQRRKCAPAPERPIRQALGFKGAGGQGLNQRLQGRGFRKAPPKPPRGT